MVSFRRLHDLARRDLTGGSIPSGVLSLAVPMIISSTFHSVLLLADMFFVGKLGAEAIAAVGMSGMALWLLGTFFMGIATATVAMVARAIGAGDEARASHVAGQAMVLTALLSAAIGAAGYVYSPEILAILGAEPRVIGLGTEFLHVTFAGAFFMMVAFVLGAVLQGAGDAVTPLLLGVLATVCNIILNPIFILGWLGAPAMGVKGSAVATLIARMISFAVGAWVLFRGRLRVRLRLSDLKPDARTIWAMFAMGVPSSLQMCFRSIMQVVLMAIVARFGTLVVAAYTVGNNIRMMALFPAFGFAGSAATMVGQNLGAGRPERSARSATVATGMALAVTGAAAIASAIFAPWIVAVFNAEPSVVTEGSFFLRVTALELIAAPIGIVLSRAMNGAGDTISPMVITLFTLWGVQIPAAVYLSGVKEVFEMSVPFTGYFGWMSLGGVSGVWYAMVAASVLQATITVAWFSAGRWKLKRV